MNLSKLLLTLLTIVAAVTLYIIVMCVGVYLLKCDIITFNYEWLKYPYYFGLGIIYWFLSQKLFDIKK